MKLEWCIAVALFGAWCATEITISLVSLGNISKRSSGVRDRLSHLVMWCSIIPSMSFAILLRVHKLSATGFGDMSTSSVPLGYVGCLVIVLGLAVRVAAVATLGRQFTTTVAVIRAHKLIDTGIYRVVRHPAYLGNLGCLCGFGLLSGNWLGFLVLVLLPIIATHFRIRVEEEALFSHFGSAYRAYASRTKRLIPGIY
jgi:protein-S-isoprenylcysteine O-methyltransferase Ste14